MINRMTNRVDLDEMAHHEPSHLDLHCLQRCLFSFTELKWYITPTSTRSMIDNQMLVQVFGCLELIRYLDIFPVIIF